MNKYSTSRITQHHGVSRWALVVLLCLSCFPGQAHAEYLGLVLGRSASPANQSELSVKAGVGSGQLGSVDFQYIGVRLNSRVAPNVVVFGDIGLRAGCFISSCESEIQSAPGRSHQSQLSRGELLCFRYQSEFQSVVYGGADQWCRH